MPHHNENSIGSKTEFFIQHNISIIIYGSTIASKPSFHQSPIHTAPHHLAHHMVLYSTYGCGKEAKVVGGKRDVRHGCDVVQQHHEPRGDPWQQRVRKQVGHGSCVRVSEVARRAIHKQSLRRVSDPYKVSDDDK